MARQIKMDELDRYREKFLKLIPLEYVYTWTGFTTMLAVSENFKLQTWLTTIVAAILLVTMPFFMRRSMKIECGNHIAASMISFVAWVYTFPLGPFSYWGIWEPEIALTIGALAALGLPAIYKPNNQCEEKEGENR